MTRAQRAKRREENEVEFSRIVAFSDGVFSIAITLLVLNLSIKSGLADSEVGGELWDQRDHFLAYGISFAVIARYWFVHHRFFGEVTAFDGRLMTLNMVYLAFVVLIPFSSEVYGEYGTARAAVILYSLNLAGVVLLGFLMANDARRAGLTTIDVEAHRESRLRSAWIASVFILSIPVAFVEAGLVPFLWLVLFFNPTSHLFRRLRGS